MRPLRFLVFSFFIVVFAEAQQPACLHYTIDEGLPSNEVYDTYEDHSGYTWFATDHGISRFDGYSFRNYSTSDGLVHNTIFGFHEDSKGRLWMRAFNSSLCYLENDSIKPYAYNKELQAFLGRDFIQRFAFDKAGNLWFVPIRKMRGLFRQDARTGKIERVKLPDGFNAFIRELDSGEFIAGIDLDNNYVPGKNTDDTIYYADHTWLFRMPESTTIDSRALIRCVRKNKSSFIFTYDASLVVIENGKIISRSAFSQVVNECYLDKKGQAWLCMDGFSPFHPGVTPSSFILKGAQGTSMLCDRVGNYWFTTIGGGVYLVRNMQLSTIEHTGNKQLGELVSLDFYERNIIVLTGKGNLFRFPVSANGPDTLSSEIFPENFPAANTFYADTTNHLLYLHSSIYQSAPGNFSRQSCKLINDRVNFSGIRGFAKTGDSLLVAANQGWYTCNTEGLLLYSSFQNGFKNFCTAIACAPDHKIWIGTTDGLYFFSGNKTVPFQPENVLFKQRVTAIKFGKNGEVFISTRGSGLIIIDGKNIYNVRSKDGLSSDQCGNICVDDSVLWLCSNNGLNRIAMRRMNGKLSFHIDRINTQHGLPSLMVNDAVRYGDLIFLATGKGLAWFDVKTLHFNQTPPPVYISTFLTNNNANADAARLTYKDRNISIGFIGLLFRSPGVVNYRYRLEGYESAWNYTTERIARYFNLPPGQYTFVVSAMNENGIWNDHPATIRFYIPAHFSETAWFRFVIILVIILVTAAIVFYFLKQQRDRARAVLALAQAEQKALRAQMKPHFIFNSLNSIQNFIINRDDDAAHIYLTSFAQLMRRVLDHSRFSAITLQEELETLGIYLGLEKLRFGETFRFSIDVQQEIQPSGLLIPPLFIQPFIENAIWHGLQLQKNMPRLAIRFFIEKNKLVCTIEDNGIGRKRSAELHKPRGHISTGMKNVEERIALLNATSREKISVEIIDLTDGNDCATGTRVVLHFPVNRKDEN
jgi:hypothetical protein